MVRGKAGMRRDPQACHRAACGRDFGRQGLGGARTSSQHIAQEGADLGAEEGLEHIELGP